MGAKNCPETPRQKMINMMYIVLTAMLALNVAAEVLQAFRVVDSSLMQTLGVVDLKNDQIYSSFEQAYIENPTKVQEWKDRADNVRTSTASIMEFLSRLKDEVVTYSGSELVTAEDPLEPDDYFHVTTDGDTLIIKKEDDLNGPSELMITQKRATDLKNEITGVVG